MITRLANLTSRLTVALIFLFGIAACGGGGGSSGGGGFIPDDGGDSSNTYTLVLELSDPDGNVTNSVTSTSPATFTVTVTSGKNPAADIVVTVEADIGSIVPESGTALTDENGVATFQIEAGDTLGAGAITATVTDDTDPVTGSLNFEVVQPDLRVGHFQDNVFIDGEIGITGDTLPAGGTTTINLAVVDTEGEKVATAVEIGLSSDCASSGLAQLPESVITSNGTATATYTANGCEGTDSIKANVLEGSGQAFGTIAIASPSAGSINFISATPESIALKGTGGPGRQEVSQVVFEVVSGTGAPISGINVQFSLSTDVGGLSLNTVSALSDGAGLVKTVVRSGNVATVVRVIATVQVEDNGSTLTLSTVSDVLVVSTGLPTQNSVSLSASFLNVVGAMDLDGVESRITVRMADKFNNTVPKGTSAVFTTEYGSIDDSCVLGISNGERITDQTPQQGECSVLWTSSNPRGFGDMGAVQIGRSTILMTAIGEESFIDANGNGTYDENELFDNLPEAFLDRNEDGSYTPASNPGDLTGAEEIFIDFNRNGIYDLNDQPAWYNGILCPQEGAGIWCSRDLLSVRGQLVLVMSEQEMNIVLVTSGGSVVGGTTEGPTYFARISDSNNNPPGGGASITVSTSGDCSLLSESSFQVADTNAPGAFEIPIRTEGDGGSSGEAGVDGTVTVKVINGGVPSIEEFNCASIPPPPPDPNAP